MKKFKSYIALMLSIVMVIGSTLPCFAINNDVEQETNKLKLVEQLKEDLGEEKAEEILFGESEIVTNTEAEEIIEAEVEDEISETLAENVEEETSEIENKSDAYLDGSEEFVEVSKESVESNDVGDLSAEETETVTETETSTSEEFADIEIKDKTISSESEIKLYGADSNTHYLGSYWYNQTTAGVLKRDVTKITFQNTGSAPTTYSASFDVDGLTAYIVNGTEVVIYIPSGHTIKTYIDPDNAFSFGTYDNILKGYASSLTSIVNLNLLDTSETEDFSSLFAYNNKLTSLDLSSFNTSKATDMHRMFEECSALTSLDLSSFNTSKVTNMRSMFSGCSGLTSLDISSFDTKEVTVMTNLFYKCKKLRSLNLSGFDTAKVTTFFGMFQDCESLESIDLDGFVTTEATDMTQMFYNCRSLTNIDITSFDTAKVTYFTGLFHDCINLINIEGLVDLDTTNADQIRNMFFGCEKLTEIDLSNFDTSKTTDIGFMFGNCTNLVDLTLWTTSTENVSNMAYMFYGCSSLENLDLSRFDTSQTTDMTYMFYGCSNLETLNISSFDMSNANYDYMIYKCSSLNTINISASVASIINNVYLEYDWKKQGSSTIYYYDNVKKKTTIPNEDGIYERAIDSNRATIIFDTDEGSYVESQTVNINSLIDKPNDPTKDNNIFLYWYKDNVNVEYDFSTPVSESFTLHAKWKAVTIITSYWYIKSGSELHFSSSEPTDPAYTSGQTFSNFNSTSDIPWSQFSTQITKVVIDNELRPTSTSYLFNGLVYLTEISNFNYLKTDDVVEMTGMFRNCSSIQYIDLSTFKTNEVRKMGDMFSGCASLDTIDLSNFNTSNVYQMYQMFNGCKVLETLDLSSLDISKVQSLLNIFNGCDSLRSLDLSSFNTEQVTNMGSMFSSCKSLTSLDLSNFNTIKVNSMQNMFNGCSMLQTIYVSSEFVTTYVTDSRDMFKFCTSLVGGKGTSYTDSHIDKEYARIDGGPASATPGYFTLGGSITPTLDSIAINTPATKVKYAVGETFNPTGLKIDLLYNDGSSKVLSYADNESDFSFNPSGALNTAGAAIPITITYTKNGNSYDCIQNVEVVELSGISINTQPSKNRYVRGTNFDPTGLKINLNYSDGSSNVVTYNATTSAGFKFNGASTLTLDTLGNPFEITVGYAGKSTTINIVVAELDSIEITTHANKLEYMAGDTFDPTGMIIKLTYTDSETETVVYNKNTSAGFTFSPSAQLTRTGNVITVTYAGKSTTETLNVKELTSIIIATNPSKLNYASGQTLNPAGLVLTLAYTDSSNNNTTVDVTYNNSTKNKFSFNPNGALTTSGNITVTYDGKTGANMQPTFAVTVKTVASISIINKPSKTSYVEGDKFAPSGLSIKVNYADGTNDNITYSSSNASDFTFNPSTTISLNTNHKNITVTYGSKTATFAINVSVNTNYVPTGGGGSSGGGSGGGGGTATPQNNQGSQEVKTTQAQTTSKNESNTKQVVSTNAAWVTDPVTGGFKLNVLNEQGLPVPATNGFYALNSVVTILVNNIPVPVPISDTYYFDATGNMVTGWVQTTDNKWYFFDNTPNANMGKMTTGWREVQGSYYYFNQDGTMMTNGITPDGYTIGADGKWVR